MKYDSREHAGKVLADYLQKNSKNLDDAIILAIPRGGVPVAYEISKKLKIKFYLAITKKITSPMNPEYAIGGIAADGSFEINKRAISMLRISDEQLKSYKDNAYEKVVKRVEKYTNGKIPIVKGKNVIIVDDGIATGFTAKVTANFAKNQNAKNVILAAPVAPKDTIKNMQSYFDEIVCPDIVNAYSFAVGMFYTDFHQNTDKELFDYLEKAEKENLIYKKLESIS